MDLFAVYYICMYLPSLLLVVLIMDAVYKLPHREIMQFYFCIAFYCVASYFLGRPSLLGFVLHPMQWCVVAFF